MCTMYTMYYVFLCAIYLYMLCILCVYIMYVLCVLCIICILCVPVYMYIYCVCYVLYAIYAIYILYMLYILCIIYILYILYIVQNSASFLSGQIVLLYNQSYFCSFICFYKQLYISKIVYPLYSQHSSTLRLNKAKQAKCKQSRCGYLYITAIQAQAQHIRQITLTVSIKQVLKAIRVKAHRCSLLLLINTCFEHIAKKE